MEPTIERNICNEVMSYYNEARSYYSGLYSVMKEDDRFYLSDQWDEKDLAILREKGVPALTLNLIKKTVDVILGYERQNRGMLKAYPIEGGDTLISEAISRVMAWAVKGQEHKTSMSFKDAVKLSLGWLHVYTDYNEDPFDGDIKFKYVNPYDILMDPHVVEQDLSDCNYLIRHKRVKKDQLVSMYPNHAERIKGRSGTYQSSDVRDEINIPNDKGEHLLCVEYWYRQYEERYFIITEQGVQMTEPSEEAIKKMVPVIKLKTVVDDSILVYDGYSPYDPYCFPFFPFFCFYDPSVSDASLRHQGVVRPLKDPQREKNKRRSAIMQIINTQVKSGWIIDKGAVDDKNKLRNSATAGVVIERNRGMAVDQIKPPTIDPNIVSIEQFFDNDIRTIGANPDLLGELNAKNEPGVAIQLRQKQGLSALKEIFDNRAIALQNIGRFMIHIISKWSPGKIKRILGEDLPFDKKKAELQQQIARLDDQISEIVLMNDPKNDGFAMQIEQQKITLEAQLQEIMNKERMFWSRWKDAINTTKFDCVVDETQNSTTVRATNFLALRELVQYNVPVPPEMFIEYMEGMSEAQKEKWMQFIQQQREAAAQAEKQKSDFEVLKLNKQMQVELVKQGIAPNMVDNARPH